MTTDDDESAPKLLYFADPMCSWCWGFAPTIEEIAARWGERAPIALVLGGLRPGTTEAMTDEDKARVRAHWEHVHEASGQPFDFSFFDRDRFVYDTEPGCRAVVVARGIASDQALPFLARLHRAFYADGRDVTDADVLTAVAGEHGFDERVFRRAFEDPAAHEAVAAEFAFAKRIGVTGFPTVVGQTGAGPELVTVGYKPKDEVLAIVEDLFGAPQDA